MSVRIPSYRLHKSTNRAVVTINGRDIYLGPYGSAKSRELYGQMIAQHAAGLEIKLPEPSPFVSVNDVVLAFMRFADKHYRKNGKLTDEYQCLKSAACPLVQLYGETDAAMFTGPAIKAVREKMIDLGWSRRYINKSIGRIRLMFKYAISEDMVEPDVLAKLVTVAPLLKGRCDAVELPKRSNVPDEHIAAVRDDVNEHTRDLIDLALLTGARPGELCNLTGSLLDRTGEVWTAVLADHKMIHKEKPRVIAFGPKSQAILANYMKPNQSAKMFPIQRKTFSANIKASCIRLGLPVFTGHWLRHNALTEIRKESGLDGAQAVAGHSDAKTTQIYAHLDSTEIVAIAKKRG